MTAYKIILASSWRDCGDVVPWSDDDRRDGFMHLSTAAQVLETAARRFAGRRDLVALEVDEAAISAALRYEKSRGGALFPHLYGALPRSAVRRVRPLALLDGGRFAFADGEAP